MCESYLDELEVIKDFGFNSYPIYEWSLLLASDLCSARVLMIHNQQDYEDVQLEDLLSNESYIQQLSPHVKDIVKRITKSIEANEIKTTFLKRDFESGSIDINNTLISFKEFNVFLDIYDLQQHIIWHEDESVLGLRVEREHQIYSQGLEIIKGNKNKAALMVSNAEFEELYKEYKQKIADDPEIINSIIQENINLRELLLHTKPTADSVKKPLNVRTENNYLRLIFSLANSIDGFNPKRPFEAAQLILDEIDINLSKETIAGYISRAYEIDNKRHD